MEGSGVYGLWGYWFRIFACFVLVLYCLVLRRKVLDLATPSIDIRNYEQYEDTQLHVLPKYSNVLYNCSGHHCCSMGLVGPMEPNSFFHGSHGAIGPMVSWGPWDPHVTLWDPWGPGRRTAGGRRAGGGHRGGRQVADGRREHRNINLNNIGKWIQCVCKYVSTQIISSNMFALEAHSIQYNTLMVWGLP